MRELWLRIVSLGLVIGFAGCGGTVASTGDTTASAADTETASDTTAADAGADAAATHTFTCNQVMGVSVTGEWFSGGFEARVGDPHWQAVTLSHAYVDLWADPTNTVWATPLTSPCAEQSDSPDRVLFVGCNWDYTTAAEWTAAFNAVIANLQAKYPKLKHIELLTMLRAPGNQSCPDAVNAETVVQPFIDAAIAKVVADHPGFVSAAPHFEAPNCDVFILGGPHFTADGQAAVAQVYGDYYANHQ